MNDLNRRSKVIVTNMNPKTDYSAARKYGNIVSLSDKVYSFVPGSAANDILAVDIHRAADDFDPAIDYVLPSGSSISTSLFLIALVDRGISKVKVLMWSGNDQCYNNSILNLRLSHKEAANV